MKALGDRSLASRLRLVLDVVLIVMMVAGALNAFLYLALIADPTSPARHLLHVTTLLKVPADLCDLTEVVRQNEPRALIETQLLAFVDYRPGSRWGVLWLVAGDYVLLGLYLGIVLKLREVFESLTSGRPFLRPNVARLRLIGWFIVAAALYRQAWNWTAYLFMVRPALSVADRPPSVPLAFVINDLHLEVLFVGAAVLVLAEIFRVGAGLHEEQTLTI